MALALQVVEHPAMTVAPTTAAGASTSTNAAASQRAFRDADFMKIMLAEITQQDPFKPQETSKIVEGMQKLQDLANSRFEKFRDDQNWARQLVGQSVSAQQMQATPQEIAALKDRGLVPDIGYRQVTGEVSSFRAVDEQVYVNINGKDYPVDHVLQVLPPAPDGAQLATAAAGLLGHTVQWPDRDGKINAGLVSAVSFGEGASLMLSVGNQAVPLRDITSVR
jgi:hypothetical protein